MRGHFFEKWTELFLDLQCHPAESWELPITGLMQCLGKSRRVHMTQQNILICIPVSWEVALISTNKCCGVGKSSGLSLSSEKIKGIKKTRRGCGEVSIWITLGLSFLVTFQSDRPKPGRLILLLNVKNIRLECRTCELGHPLQLPCVVQQAASTLSTPVSRAEAEPRAHFM